MKVNLSPCVLGRRKREVEVWLHSPLTSAPDKCQWEASRPGSFNSGKETRYSLNRSWSGRSGEKKNLWSLLEFEPKIVQPVALSLYPIPARLNWSCGERAGGGGSSSSRRLLECRTDKLSGDFGNLTSNQRCIIQKGVQFVYAKYVLIVSCVPKNNPYVYKILNVSQCVRDVLSLSLW